jgi:hypothetical protein
MHTKSAAIAVFVVTVFSTGRAAATMPRLTEMPNPPSDTTCKNWAGRQDEDAIYMWGIQQNGSSSRNVALDRLVRHCSGEPIPDIVGFGSSIGFDEAYRKRFPTIRLCHGLLRISEVNS